MGSPFRSLTNARPVKVEWSEEQVVAVARQLLDAHAKSRADAAKEINLVCGNCQGTGKAASTLMPGESLTCFACEGTGKPNEHMQAVPPLSPKDNHRLWQIGRLLQGLHRVAVLQVVKEFYPDMYPAEAEAAPS